MDLPNCLRSQKERLDAAKRNRAGAIRSELSTLHNERLDFGLQRRLEKEKQLKDLMTLEEEIRLLYLNRRKRFVVQTRYRGEYSAEYCDETSKLQPMMDLEEDVRAQLEQGLLKLHDWSQPRRIDCAITEATVSTAVSKSLSPSDRKAPSLPAGSSALTSPKLSQIPELEGRNRGIEVRRKSGGNCIERWDTNNRKVTKENVTDSPIRQKLSKMKTEKPIRKANGPTLNETLAEVHSFDYRDDGNTPATPCNTIDFPRIGTSLSPSTRANRRKVYWTQRVKHDFSPLVENGKTKALIDIRSAPKAPKRYFRLVKLVDIAKK